MQFYSHHQKNIQHHQQKNPQKTTPNRPMLVLPLIAFALGKTGKQWDIPTTEKVQGMLEAACDTREPHILYRVR